MDIYSPLVSVIIPNYNYCHFIGEAIASVLGQTHQNLECIIVDDGSTDNSVEIIKTIQSGDNRVILVQKTNGGLPSTRNEGIKIAKGEYLAFLDSDDIWTSDKISNQLIAFKENPGVSIVFSNSISFNRDGEISRCATQENQIDFFHFLAGNPIPGCSSSIMIEKKVIANVGFFDNDLRSSEDQDFLFRCALKGFKFLNTSKYDVLIRKHSNSMLSNYIKMFYNNMYCFEKDLRLVYKTNKIHPGNIKRFNHSVIDRLSSVRWHARELQRFDLIIYTYLRSIELNGFKFFFHLGTLKSLSYDFTLYISKWKKKVIKSKSHE